MKLQSIILAIFVAGAFKHVHAEMVMVLRGEPDSSIVSFELSGSDWAKAGLEDSVLAGTAFFITDGYDPFPLGLERLTPGLNLLSGGGTISNTSKEQSIPIAGILAFDDRASSHGLDGFGVFWVGWFDVWAGDRFEWRGSGTVDLAEIGMVFGDLNPGIGVAEARVSSIGPFLDGRLIIVPEPSFNASLLFAIPLLRRRRRTLGRD